MTTAVVYKGHLAVDGRVVSDPGVIETDVYQKIDRITDDAFLVAAGSFAEVYALVKSLAEGVEYPVNMEEPEAILIRGGTPFLIQIQEGNVYETPMQGMPTAIGSGRRFALSFLDLATEPTAADAVKYAATRDCSTGSIVFTYRLSNMLEDYNKYAQAE